MIDQCWPTVVDGEPTLVKHWVCYFVVFAGREVLTAGDPGLYGGTVYDFLDSNHW